MTAPQPAELQKTQRRMMTGAMLVMGACVFGGLTAVVLMVLNQRMAAAIVAAIAGATVIAGVGIQVAAVKRLKALEKAKGRPT